MRIADHSSLRVWATPPLTGYYHRLTTVCYSLARHGATNDGDDLFFFFGKRFLFSAMATEITKLLRLKCQIVGDLTISLYLAR
jgi:hypothetical protein